MGSTFRPYGMPEVHRAIRACRWLSDRAKLVWAALVDRQGSNGECYPGNAKIAADIGGIPERRVRGYIAELETAMLIRRQTRVNTTGRNSSNLIEFLWRPLEELSPDAGVRRRRTLVSGGRRTLVSSRTNTDRTKPIERTPNPSEEDARVQDKEPGCAPEKRPNDRSVDSMDIWSAAGWSGSEEFETWWADLVCHHPNKSRNAVARTRALELIQTGSLNREAFEFGYKALAEAKRERWRTEGGRFASNLLAILDDGLWRFTPSAPERNYVDNYIVG
jgi:Helix-turn-helix domain